MKHCELTEKEIRKFRKYLADGEYAQGTQEKYLRDVEHLRRWLDGQPLTKRKMVGWKDHLLRTGYAPVTVNGMLAALNCFFKTMGWNTLRVKELRIQRRLFRSRERELSKEEYMRLLDAARGKNKQRLALLMETICATGIRVSEVRYITVETVQQGRAEISLKGKIRTILIPNKLCRKLQKYAKKEKIASGEIFLTRSGKGISRRQIWAEMKAICVQAGVAATKVFPHNFRHLFARTFYKACKDVAKLADVLGHSSIDTTRIYLISTGYEHAQQLERLGLIC